MIYLILFVNTLLIPIVFWIAVKITKKRIGMRIHNEIATDLIVIYRRFKMAAKGDGDHGVYHDFSLELNQLSFALRDFSHSLYTGERNIALNILLETKKMANNMVKPTDECQVIINYNWPNNSIGLKKKDLNGLLDIIKEGIVNAMKNGNAERIYLDFWEEELFYILRVEDNGKGFNFASVDISNSIGIKMMKKRAQNLNAVLDIKSTEGTGTTIHLKIPNK